MGEGERDERSPPGVEVLPFSETSWPCSASSSSWLGGNRLPMIMRLLDQATVPSAANAFVRATSGICDMPLKKSSSVSPARG